MHTWIVLSLLVLLGSSASALADSDSGETSTPSRAESQGRFHLEARVLYGSTFGNSSTYVVINDADTSLGQYNERASATSQLGFEVGLVSRDQLVGAFIDLEINRYDYPDQSVSDGQTGVSFNAKIFLGSGRIRPWLAGGVGVLDISFGGPLTQESDGVTLTIPSSMVSFELTPKIGVDVTVAGPLFVTAQLGLTGSVGYANVTASEKGETGTFTLEVRRWWWQANGGIGVRL